MSKIVILAGSPRRGGNSDLLTEAFARRAARENEVKIIRVADLSIAPCRGCNACFGEGNRCVQRDDMESVIEELRDADVLGIASPVYFYGISAQIAAAIHRLHNPVRDTFHIKKAFLLLAAASRREQVCEPIRLQYTLLTEHFGIENLGIVAAQGVKEPGDAAAAGYTVEAEALAAKI